jgi:hypothetical protein
MAKAILKFNLDNEEDRISHLRYVKSLDMASFIWELQHNFWRKWKHDESNFTLSNYKEELYLLLEEYSINIEELTE